MNIDALGHLMSPDGGLSGHDWKCRAIALALQLRDMAGQCLQFFQELDSSMSTTTSLPVSRACLHSASLPLACATAHFHYQAVSLLICRVVV